MSKTIMLDGLPYPVPAEQLKLFLEKITDDGTVFALEVKISKREGYHQAKVQFTEARYAEIIVQRVLMGLVYMYCSLNVWKCNDFVRKPGIFEHQIEEEVTLNFGCQISRDRFSVLWKAEKVSVRTRKKKMYFFLSYNMVEYKFELSSENISAMCMHTMFDPTENILVAQLYGGLRIYNKLQTPTSSYFRETPDDQWIRTTDFTPSLISQSSGLCFNLTKGKLLPTVIKSMSYYRESQVPLLLEMGVPFSDTNSSLVPIIRSLGKNELPYRILFKVCSLVQMGYLPGPILDATFFRLVDPKISNIEYIDHALEKMSCKKVCRFDPTAWLNRQYEKYRTNSKHLRTPSILLDEGWVYVRRVQITPTRVYFSGPEVNKSNRVLRQYMDHIDNFLLVSFVDEEWGKMYSSDLSPRGVIGEKNKRTKLYERVLSILRDGIQICSKRFEFLAFSSSQVCENSLWMFAPTDDLNADGIRQWMGDFRSIRNVAKYAARLGQSFDSSTETLSVFEQDFEIIEDIKDASGKYVFSDGIGKISDDFAQSVAKKCGFIGSRPSAFQIRYSGYKGVVAVDPFMYKKKLSLRPSMYKYESKIDKLDVLSWSKFQPCFLNRQIITLLSYLGVEDHVFIEKQRDAISKLDDTLSDPLRAQEVLDMMYPEENTNVLKEMLKCGYHPNSEPFLSLMLQAFRSSKLSDLKLKAEIFVPLARQMMGCLDETDTLLYGEVFVQVSAAGRGRFNEESGVMLYDHTLDSDFVDIVKGKVVVAKNSCLYPGDVRVLEAVDVPALHHMVDCIVFPRKGKRPHPNECSGSDLDGDMYFVCWDPSLIPPTQVEPMDYSPPASTKSDHDVTIEEVEEYFTNYILNDTLGIIANAHTAFADKEPERAMSDSCKKLAHLFSVAVDFPKTGIPAVIPPELRVKEYPDFMEKPDKATYVSTSIIGKLWRGVKDIDPNMAAIQLFTIDVARTSFDDDLIVSGYKDYLDEAVMYKTNYDFKLKNLMDYYGIVSEFEILSCTMTKITKTFDKRKDVESIGSAVRALKSEAQSWFRKRRVLDNLDAKASAWYFVTYEPSYWDTFNEGLHEGHYISFPWCVYDRLLKIKKDKLKDSSKTMDERVQDYLNRKRTQAY